MLPPTLQPPVVWSCAVCAAGPRRCPRPLPPRHKPAAAPGPRASCGTHHCGAARGSSGLLPPPAAGQAATSVCAGCPSRTLWPGHAVLGAQYVTPRLNEASWADQLGGPGNKFAKPPPWVCVFVRGGGGQSRFGQNEATTACAGVYCPGSFRALGPPPKTPASHRHIPIPQRAPQGALADCAGCVRPRPMARGDTPSMPLKRWWVGWW